MDPKNKRVGKKKSRPQLQPFQPSQPFRPLQPRTPPQPRFDAGYEPYCPNYDHYPTYDSTSPMPIQVSSRVFRLQPKAPSDVFTTNRDPYQTPNFPQHQLVDDEYEDETNQDKAFDDVRDTKSEDEVPKEDKEEVDTRGKKKASGGRAKSIPWNGKDEALLAKAYFHISTDPKVGDQQKFNSFWGRVAKHYNSLQTKHSRSYHQINTK